MFKSSLYRERKTLDHSFSKHFPSISSGPGSGLGRPGKMAETEEAQVLSSRSFQDMRKTDPFPDNPLILMMLSSYLAGANPGVRSWRWGAGLGIAEKVRRACWGKQSLHMLPGKGVTVQAGESSGAHGCLLPQIVLPPHLERIREKLAENIHELWALTRIEQGWTYGPVSDYLQRQAGLAAEGGHGSLLGGASG